MTETETTIETAERFVHGLASKVELDHAHGVADNWCLAADYAIQKAVEESWLLECGYLSPENLPENSKTGSIPLLRPRAERTARIEIRNCEMGVFDQAARLSAHGDPDAVTRRVLAGTKAVLRFKDWADSRTLATPGGSDRTADHVAVLEDAAAPELPWLLVFEFQSRHDPDKLDVTLEEAARIRIHARHGQNRQGKFRVLTTLIYLQGRCPDAALDMTLAEGFGTRHAPLIWNVAEDSAEATVTSVATGQASWGMCSGLRSWREATSRNCSHAGGNWHQQSKTDADVATIALVFAELGGRYLVWEKSLEGFDMTESKVANRFIEQGQIKEARENLVRVLRKRFPAALSDDILGAINSQPSLDMLHDWSDAATSAASAEEFIATLRR